MTFNDSAKVCIGSASISEVETGAIEYTGGSTNFTPVLTKVQQAALELRKQEATAGEKSLVPVLVFMTDGVPRDGAIALEFSKNLMQSLPDLSAHLLLFGNEHRAETLLKAMSQAMNGTVHKAADMDSLKSVFSTIATRVSYL